MLKVKRIAKVMLCFCVAFSMFISINAEATEITINNNALTYTSIPNDIISNEKYDIIASYGYIIEKASYNINPYPISGIININFNDNNEYNILVVAQYSETKSIKSYNGTINYIRKFSIGFVGIKPYYVQVYNVIPNNNNINFELYHLSQGVEKPASISSIIIQPIINHVQENNNLIKQIFNGIITNSINIFNFVIDKPWIILLGVSVSLISFLIYKSKSIIR